MNPWNTRVKMEKLFMKRVNRMTFIIYLILLTIFCFTVAVPAANKSQSSSTRSQARLDYAENMVVIKFKQPLPPERTMSKTGQPQVDQILSHHQIYQLQSVLPEGPGQRLEKLRSRTFNRVFYAFYSGDQDPLQVAHSLMQNEAIEYAEPKYLHYIDAIPNDPSYAVYQAAYYDIIQAPQAWDYIKGEQGNIVVAVVDGGTDYDHPDLAANFWVNSDEIAGNKIDDDSNGFIDDINGWNFANNTADPTGLANSPQNARHGSHVGGIIAAVSNNNTGVAGVSWNVTLMPINAASSTADNSIAYGYDGILYAAYNGADIINCSWGRLGGASIYEQEVMDEVGQLGVLVVAAAGNNNSSGNHYPSSYNHVFSVGATGSDDSKAAFSNFGPTVDVSAPGINIYSTYNSDQYGYMSGTSQASPLTAGVIGLVKTQHPDWSSIQAAEQVRVTSDEIPSHAGQLGKGRINALRALTENWPSIRISKVDILDSDQDGVIEPGESVQIYVTLTNYLTSAGSVALTLSTTDTWVTIGTANLFLTTIGTLEEITPGAPFTFQVVNDAPSGHPVPFTLNISSGNYQDHDSFSLVILPTYGNTTVSNVDVTVTNVGRIGFPDVNDPTQGIGFKYKDGANLLFEGTVIAGTGSTRLSNAARGMGTSYDQDFSVGLNGDLQIVTPGYQSDEESYGAFEDNLSENPLNIRIEQETYAYNQPGYQDFVIFKYRIVNKDQLSLDNFHFGLFFDWDMDGNSYETNVAAYDAPRRMGYVYDSGGGPDTYIGVAALSDGSVSYRAIYNDNAHPSNPPWGLYDGFSDAEKWEAISGGTTVTTAGPADISNALALGPYSINGYGTLTIGFALLGGDNLSTLRVHADSAQAVWEKLVALNVEEPPSPEKPDRYSLSANYPNPFNPSTQIIFQIKHTSNVQLEIYNNLGQKIRSLVNGLKESGRYQVQWDGRDETGRDVASGLYLYRLKTGEFEQTRKMLLLR